MRRMQMLRSLVAVFVLALPLAAHASLLGGFDDLEIRLRLDHAQKAQFDHAVAATRRALMAVAFSVLEVKEDVLVELAKARPDLEALARAQEAAIERNRPLFREARREWARLYAMLDPEQVRIARRFVEEKMARLEGLGREIREFVTRRLKERS